MKDVVIVSACRTAIGAFGGTLRDSNAADIAAVTMKEAVNRAGIDPAQIDDIRYGCCMEPVDALNVARRKAFDALNGAVPESAPASKRAKRKADQKNAGGGPGAADDPTNPYDVPWQTEGLRGLYQELFSSFWHADAFGGTRGFEDSDVTPE